MPFCVRNILLGRVITNSWPINWHRLQVRLFSFMFNRHYRPGNYGNATSARARPDSGQHGGTHQMAREPVVNEVFSVRWSWLTSTGTRNFSGPLLFCNNYTHSSQVQISLTLVSLLMADGPYFDWHNLLLPLRYWIIAFMTPLSPLPLQKNESAAGIVIRI